MASVVNVPDYVFRDKRDVAPLQTRPLWFLKQSQLIRHFDSAVICYDIMLLLRQTDEAIIPPAKDLRAILQAR